MNKFEIARLKYKPKIIRYLLIAETPPKSDSNRFFYFENVMDKDSLFLETMKVLYPKDTINEETIEIRKRKAIFLNTFKNDGFYLIDSLKEPFDNKYSSSQKIKIIKNGQKDLLLKIKPIIDKNTKIILISATVFKADYEYLKQNKINVINEELVDFPLYDGLIRFRYKMTKLLKI